MVNGVKCLFGLGKKRTEIYSSGLTARESLETLSRRILVEWWSQNPDWSVLSCKWDLIKKK